MSLSWTLGWWCRCQLLIWVCPTSQRLVGVWAVFGGSLPPCRLVTPDPRPQSPLFHLTLCQACAPYKWLEGSAGCPCRRPRAAPQPPPPPPRDLIFSYFTYMVSLKNKIFKLNYIFLAVNLIKHCKWKKKLLFLLKAQIFIWCKIHLILRFLYVLMAAHCEAVWTRQAI